MKTLNYLIVYPITKLINMCTENNVCLASLKLAKILPLFKTGCENDLCNFRPISIIPIIAKIFEILLKNHVNTSKINESSNKRFYQFHQQMSGR
ncbi:unnamed protein product [Acanthoscelides obtectus]|uniref:Uncharacterized protein n=1 Tax=Acanthoscelides obtectus TaxID=200917 RepID=A0A9P0KGI6_ACAOB|nr:unnamed protein product [Acanthoscelides obtectus]CAK1660501.1 hypothetical protein AOBTE_LOCUS22120 [Acanthoscelides obtectus]